MVFKKNTKLTRREFIDQTGKTATALFLLGSLPMTACSTLSVEMKYDTVIKGGTIYDGTLNQPIQADVGIKNDKIVEIGIIEGSGSKIIDATKLIVTPGFIDVHTHCDLTFKRMGKKRYLAYVMPSWKGNYNYIYQGVSTVVTGNCGYGYTNTEHWHGIVDSLKFGSNVSHLVPHGMIREELFGSNQPRELSQTQLGAMQKRVAEEMEKGAIGISTGLEYSPGYYASTRELIELAKVVKQYGGIYTTHMRDESGRTVGETHGVIVSINEAIEIARQAEISVEISHLKINEPINDTKPEQVLELIENARQEGLDIHADQYPYAAGSTYLTILLPDRFKTAVGVKDKFKVKIGRAEILKAINEVFEYLPPEKILITMYAEKENYEGKTLQEIAELEDREPAESYADMASEDTAPMAVFFSQDLDIVRELMPNDYVLTASDGWTVPKGMTKPHPRLYGTFPKKLKQFVIDEKRMDFQMAIRSMTSLPAKKFNINNRGILAKGNYADIAVINIDTICDHATYHDPHRYADGIEYLLVNGKLSIEKGEATGKRAGKAIKRI